MNYNYLYLFFILSCIILIGRAAVQPIGQACEVYVEHGAMPTNQCGSYKNPCLNVKYAIQSCGQSNAYVVVYFIDGPHTDIGNFNQVFVNQTIVYQAVNIGKATLDMTGIKTPLVTISDTSYTAGQSTDMYANFHMNGVNVVNSNSAASIIQTMVNLTQISVKVDQCGFYSNVGGNGTVFNLKTHYSERQTSTTISITNSSFKNNKGVNGVVLYAQSTDNIYINNCVFYGNSASGVGIINPDTISLVTITQSNFTSNYVQSGGVVHFDSMQVSPVVSSNRFDSNSGGGVRSSAIAMLTTTGIIDNTNFTNNFNLSGVLVYSSIWVNITNSFFTGNNLPQFYGAGVYFEKSGILIYDSVFANNYALYGGAIYSITNIVYTYIPLIKNTIIEDNNATISGGGLFTSGITLKLTNVSIENNLAANGSNFYCLGSQVYTNNTEFLSYTDNAYDNELGIMCGSSTCSIKDISVLVDNEIGCGVYKPPAKKGLTDKEKIGIAVGISSVFIITVIIIIVIIRKKHHHHHYHSIRGGH
ncbi:hypothetical protein CYY_002426 [Polysphondylium violaceum]|uniref:Right handed beta helix domain-containing protein n=1 Tax=Polysphondylium violaceum TaxID=133409 RepID=A0A8J4PWE4_9MYCE|nr:hypothetical protein CYY_002426 [Polysphondylium violaceum]